MGGDLNNVLVSVSIVLVVGRLCVLYFEQRPYCLNLSNFLCSHFAQCIVKTPIIIVNTLRTHMSCGPNLVKMCRRLKLNMRQ